MLIFDKNDTLVLINSLNVVLESCKSSELFLIAQSRVRQPYSDGFQVAEIQSNFLKTQFSTLNNNRAGKKTRRV